MIQEKISDLVSEASKMTKIFLLLISFLLLIQIWSSISDDITIYWGQNSNEGNLKETCATGLYSIVVIGFLWRFGNGTIPQLNLSGHCDPSSSSGCTSIGREIKYCQQQGIKVLLSIGGGLSNYSLSSEADLKKVSDYLWDNFIGGSSSSLPLGGATLDGIDFDIQSSSGSYYEELAIYLKSLSTNSQKVYLSASPQCPFPDPYLGSALFHGLFDYVWVQFYANPSCEYSEANTSQFVNAWNQWATSLYGSKSKIFLGLLASRETTISGYVPADLLISEVLPTVNKSPNYGGVMLWTSYEDRLSEYSTYLQLCAKPQSAPKCRNHDNGFEGRLGYMSGDSIKVYGSENLGGQCCETICRNNCSCKAYAPLSQGNNTGCQIWLKGSRFIEDAGSKGQSIYIVRHKGMPCFLTCNPHRHFYNSFGILILLYAVLS